jgi:hypothetical protein
MRLIKHSLAVALARGTSLLLAAGCLAAPAKTRCVLVLNVPFEFQVGHRSLPPGYYEIEQIVASSKAKNLLLIRGLNGLVYQTVFTELPRTQETAAESKVVFRHSSGKAVLAQVWSREKKMVVDLVGTTAEPRNAVAFAEGPDAETSLPCSQEILVAKSQWPVDLSR